MTSVWEEGFFQFGLRRAFVWLTVASMVAAACGGVFGEYVAQLTTYSVLSVLMIVGMTAVTVGPWLAVRWVYRAIRG